jgi:hypothetical protein
MIASPVSIAVTFPDESTIAILSSLLVHIAVLYVAVSGRMVRFNCSLYPLLNVNEFIFSSILSADTYPNITG